MTTLSNTLNRLRDMLGDPRPQIERVNAFLGGKLDTARMAEVVDPALYRNRS